MRVASRSLVLIVACVVRGTAAANCVSYESYTVAPAATIGVHTGPTWAAAGKPNPPIGSAIELWHGGCAGMSGSQFPALRDNAGGDINVTVEYMSGRMNRPDKPGACAQFVPNGNPVSSGVIEIWSNSHDGTDCTWMQPHATLDNIIAHELGHAFGLANSNCPQHDHGS